jgi:hypothetical protein
MAVDLFSLGDFETASGDAGWQRVVPSVRAVWTAPIDGESGAPSRRIIHCRTLRLHAPARLHRLGVRQAQGYHKCGSHIEIDWVTAFRVLAWNGTSWRVHCHVRDLPRPKNGEILWFDLDDIETSAAMVEARACGIDQWWPSWNLTSGAFVLEGEPPSQMPVRKENRLHLDACDIRRLPPGVTASTANGEVRYRTRFLEVGFCLSRAGFSYLSLDDEGKSRTDKNLLRSNPGVSLQGLRFHSIGLQAAVAPLVRNDVEGTTTVQGNTVTCNLVLPNAGQRYLSRWEVLEDRLRFHAERNGAADLRTWESCVWNIACHSEVASTSVIGKITREGEAGILALPIYFHAPGFGSLAIEQTGSGGICRSDSVRPLKFTTLEFKVGEVPQADGDYLLPAGLHTLDLEMTVRQPELKLDTCTPEAIRRAIRRCTLTSMSYRADTATLTNNGNSMHCPICMDNWSSLATRIGTLLPGVCATDLLRNSLERWLDGGPGYASGRMMRNEKIHFAEDEYIMTGTAGLLGLAEFLGHSGVSKWVDAYEAQIKAELDRMRARDLDGDGLVESPYRLGVSGQNHWSTCWYDVISFGWKDAFSNALLYRALVLLARILPQLGKPSLANGLTLWAESVRKSFLSTFYNEKTGWLAGWRCKKGELHDYAFLAVNGAAVCSGVLEDTTARGIIERLWKESQRIGLPDYRFGLPNNLWPIPDKDVVEIMHGEPFGYYANGGLTHSQSRHFVGALYKVGLKAEADHVLERLCSSLADATAFGGCNSGVDWRYWDGWPCGYEGLLTDQFGILAVALERYGALKKLS